MGKQIFRPFLDSFIDNSFRNAKSENQNRALSAQVFIVELGKVYGESILRGVLSMVDDGYVNTYLSYKQTLQYMRN